MAVDTEAAFTFQKKVIHAATECAKPADDKFMELVGPIVAVMNKVCVCAC
jgi:hypothetical protein